VRKDEVSSSTFRSKVLLSVLDQPLCSEGNSEEGRVSFWVWEGGNWKGGGLKLTSSFDSVVMISPKAESSTAADKQQSAHALLTSNRSRKAKEKKLQLTGLPRIPHSDLRNLLEIPRYPDHQTPEYSSPLPERTLPPGFLSIVRSKYFGGDGAGGVGGEG